MDNVKIGSFISFRRKALGMTQQELADKLQITNRAVSKWEKGDGLPDISMLTPLAAQLSVSVDELLSGEAAIIIPSTETTVNATVPSVNHNAGRSGLNRLFSVVFAFGLAVAFSYDNLDDAFFNIFYFSGGSDSSIQNLQAGIIFTLGSLFWMFTAMVLYSSILKLFKNNRFSGKTAAIISLLLAVTYLILNDSFDLSIIPTSSPSFGVGICSVLIVFHGYKAPFKRVYYLVLFGGFFIIAVDMIFNLTQGFPVNLKEYINIFFERQAVPAITFMLFIILYGLSFRRISDKRSLQEV